MKEVKPADTLKIRYFGTFKLSDLLSTMSGWIKGANFNYAEPKYKHKGSGEGADLEIEMVGDRKITDYYKFKVFGKLIGTDVKDVEVLKDGKKEVMQHGRLLIEVGGEMEIDWQNRFTGSGFIESLQKFYNNHIIKHSIETYQDKLTTMIKQYQTSIRTVLGLETER